MTGLGKFNHSRYNKPQDVTAIHLDKIVQASCD